jgi:hypothetical protein
VCQSVCLCFVRGDALMCVCLCMNEAHVDCHLCEALLSCGIMCVSFRMNEAYAHGHLCEAML